MSDLKARLEAAALAASKPIPVQTQAFGLVHVKRITVDSSQDLSLKNGGLDEKKALLTCLCDEYGAETFDPGNPNDAATVGGLSKVDVARILLALYTGNGLGEVGAEAAQKN